MRTSIRTLFVVVGLFALVFGWYCRAFQIRSSEKVALDSIGALCDDSFSVVRIEDGGGACATWSGGVAYTQPSGPWGLQWLDLDAFRRVTVMEFQHESEVDILPLLTRFSELKSITFNNGFSAYPSSDEAQLAGGLRVLSACNPALKVNFDFSQFKPRLHGIRRLPLDDGGLTEDTEDASFDHEDSSENPQSLPID